MKYAYFDKEGRVETAANDDTIRACPQGAVELSEEQFANRFDLSLVDGVLVIDPYILPPKAQKELDAINEAKRAAAYKNESDPLFFKWQRGEVDKQAWLDKVAEIKKRCA